MSSHKDIDMMSFTGSTRAGIAVAKASADTVKRVDRKGEQLILFLMQILVLIAGGVTSCFTILVSH